MGEPVLMPAVGAPPAESTGASPDERDPSAGPSAEPVPERVAGPAAELPAEPVAEPVRRPGHRPTIKDVAALAGVSSSAAVRAISGTGYVGERARQRVLAAAAELGYVPHVSARSLKTRVTRAVGVLVDDVRHPADAALLAGVLAAAAEHGLATMVADRAAAGRPVESVLQDFVAFSVAGVVCVPGTDEAVRYLTRYGIRAVEVPVAVPGTDAAAAGRAAVERVVRDLDRDPARAPRPR